jgi:signal transduction histidine kinase
MAGEVAAQPPGMQEGTAGAPSGFVPRWLTRAIRDENVLLFLLGVRWLSLLPPLLDVLAQKNALTHSLTLYVLCAALLANVALSFWHGLLNSWLLRYPLLLAADLMPAALFLALTGGPQSPYGLYALAPLLAASFFFAIRGGLLAALGLSVFYGIALILMPIVASPIAVFEQVMGFFLIALMFGYPTVLLRRLKDANAELQRAQEDVSRATALAALGKTVAHVSHEVRNPLVTMGGLARQIQRHSADEETVRHHAAVIAQETLRLESLLNDVLTVARPPQLKFARGNLHEILDQACLLASGVDRGRVVFEKDYDPSLPWLRACAPALLRAFLNVLRNAVQAMPDGGKVRIETRFLSDRDRVQILISDNGPGISPDMLAKLFEPFVTSSADGTGLGLAITRQIVQEHGGSLDAQNRPEGGAQFVIELPLAPGSADVP